MANSFLNAKEYANVMLMLLKNQLVMGRLVDGKFRNQVTDENGLQIYVKRPPRFIAGDGAPLDAQPVVTGSTSLSVNRYRNVHISIGDLEAVQSWNALMKSETMKSAASTLAHDVDLYLHQQLLKFPSHVGTVGQTVKTPAQFNKVHTRLMDQSVPNMDLSAVVTFEDGELIRGSLLAGYIDGINRNALQKVKIPVLSEIDLYATQHVRNLTPGTRVAAATTLVDGATQISDYVDVKDADYSILHVDTATEGHTYKAGEIFTIADVYAVNPRSNDTLPYLRQFVIMEDAVALAGGDVDLKIFPHIIVGGTGGAEADTNTAFATCSATPADDAIVTFAQVASTADLVRAAWHKQAIQLVSARLVTPMSDTSSFATDPETGISIRYWRGSDISTGAHIHRWDMIYGAGCVDPMLGARFSGASA